MGLTSNTVNEKPVQETSLGKSGSGPHEKKNECSETGRKTDLVQKV